MPAAPPRQRLLDAARELLYVDGIHATGVDALSARAGVSKRTLYREFGTKDGLVAEYLRCFGETGVLPAEDLLADPDRPGRDRLLDALDQLGRDVEDWGWRGCPATNAALELTEPGHPALRVSAEHKRRFRERARAALADAGVPEPAIAAEQVAVLWDGALVQAVLQRSAEPVLHARALVASLLEGASR